MTGILSSAQPKKRKHREDSQTNPSVSQKKKEKRHRGLTASVLPLSQDVLLHKPKPRSPEDKGKSRVLDHLSEFRIVDTSIILSVPPVFARDLRAGVEEMLDSMVMRYIPSLQGVLLAHSSVRFLNQTASIHGDCPFAVCNVNFDATVWGPCVSMKLVGRINVCSPDHISLLVHRTFNVSIPRHHIPQDQWLFEYGSAENDPEFRGERVWDTGSESKGTADGDGDKEMNDSVGSSGESREADSSGRWVHHLTGVRLGDPDGYVEFTVIGLTVANEMLSLQGSIQPDPFSPEHVPHPERVASSPSFLRDETPVSEDQHGGVMEEGEESDTDGFEHPAKLTDKTQAAQKTKRAKEEAGQSDKKKKLKRRKDHVSGDEDPHQSKRAERKQLKESKS